MRASRGGRPAGPVGGIGRRPSGGTRTADDADAGVATVLVAAGLAALVLIVAAATWLAAAMTARHRAGSAADLAALAGAAVVVRGADAVCAAAVRVAQANGAALGTCQVTGVTVRVTATVDVRVGPIVGTADGRAQAGPVVSSTAVGGVPVADDEAGGGP